MSTLRSCLLLLPVILLCTAGTTTAQQGFRSELIIRNNGGEIDTLRWGIEPGATYGIDTDLGEFEWPPFPVSEVFSVRLINVPGRTELGEGVKLDLRPYRSADQVDTFNIKLQSGNGGYPLTVTWPADLGTHARRLQLVTLLDATDMLTATSATITNPGIQQAMIIREGDAVASAGDENVTAGAVVSLEQVMPNPAASSRAASIAYTLTRRSSVALRLYDALGRQRATLAEGSHGAGRHMLSLPLSDLEPGSYYITLVVETTMLTRGVLVVD